MREKIKRVLAVFLAAIIVCTTIELPIKLEAAEVPSPALPFFESASSFDFLDETTAASDIENSPLITISAKIIRYST